LIRYVSSRSEFIRDEFARQHNYNGKVVVIQAPSESGEVFVNGQLVKNEATYYTSMEVHIEVKVKAGFRFVAWNNPEMPISRDGIYVLRDAGELNPIFRKK